MFCFDADAKYTPVHNSGKVIGPHKIMKRYDAQGAHKFF